MPTFPSPKSQTHSTIRPSRSCELEPSKATDRPSAVHVKSATGGMALLNMSSTVHVEPLGPFGVTVIEYLCVGFISTPVVVTTPVGNALYAANLILWCDIWSSIPVVL